MSARSIGDLLASTAHDTAASGHVAFWRCTYDVTDKRAQVGRPFGDGSTAQGWKAIRAIVDTGMAWVSKVGAVTDETGRTYKLRWELIRTLRAVLGCMNFATGEIIATYEMIAKAAKCCRLTAIRHMAILRKYKWINWVRRSEPGGEGKKASWAPNAYFFEISQLPTDVQIHLRQILKRQGVKLESHPERKGSGPVPNRVQRLAERLAKGFARATDRLRNHQDRQAKMREADFIRAEMEALADLPTDQWASTRHPGDLAAQEAYNRRLGICSDHDPSNRSGLDSGVIEPKEKGMEKLGASPCVI